MIAWSNKKQPTIALSSTEAKYKGAIIVTYEEIWLKGLLQDPRVEVVDPTPIYCDNLNNIQLAKNLVFHARTKYIEVHYHFVCRCVVSGEVEVSYVQTYWQVDGIFTNPLGLDKLRHFQRCFNCSISTCRT